MSAHFLGRFAQFHERFPEHVKPDDLLHAVYHAAEHLVGHAGAHGFHLSEVVQMVEEARRATVTAFGPGAPTLPLTCG